MPVLSAGEGKDELLIREFTRLFRCTPEMAPTYIKRIRERMGYEVPIETIVAALHKISPKRLTMDTLIDRLRKMERAPAPDRSNRGPALSRSPERSRRVEGPKPSAMTHISMVLTRNWERGRKQGLKPPVMTTDRFVKTAQSMAGAPKPSVARVLRSVEKLDRMDVLLTPNLVADDINESPEPLRPPPAVQ